MKFVITILFYLTSNFAVSQIIPVDSFFINHNRYFKSKFLLIGESHNVSNNLFYLPILKMQLFEKRTFSNFLLEMSHLDALWMKIKINSGDSLAIVNAFEYPHDKELYGTFYSYFKNKPLDSIPIIGVDNDHDWRSSLLVLLDFAVIRYKSNPRIELQNLIIKLKILLYSKKYLKKKLIIKILDYVLKENYFNNERDILIVAHSMNNTLDVNGLRRQESKYRDNIILNNIRFIDSFYPRHYKFIGIFGSRHLINNQNNKYRKYFKDNTLIDINIKESTFKKKLDIQTIVIYNNYKFLYYMKNERKNSLLYCPIDSQLEERLSVSKKLELIKLSCCYDFALINIP